MSAKIVLVLCAQALFVQTALSQCTSRAAVAAEPGLITPAALAAPYGVGAPALAFNGLAAPFAYDGLAGWAGRGLASNGLSPAIARAMDFTPTSGGALPVTSGSAIPPTGLSVVSENVYEGILAAAGEVPFVGTTGVEGVLSTTGAGAINHACGNGINAMAADTTAFAPGYLGVMAPATAIAPLAGITPAAATAPAAAAIAPGAFAGRGLGYRAGRGGCAL